MKRHLKVQEKKKSLANNQLGRDMKVLMFGWEFPPYISGGLGTACYGLTQGLGNLGEEITFVLPKPLQGMSQYINGVLVGPDSVQSNSEKELEISETREKLSIIEVESALSPYLSEKEYSTLTSKERETQYQHKVDVRGTTLSKTQGGLIGEVLNFAGKVGKFGGTVTHDVIHCHDWMTILAALEARKYSRKPVIFHVHSLEYDRCGSHGSSQIEEIEHKGLHDADSIVAVSNYTKRVIVSRYGVSPDKITVIHNGVLPSPKKDDGSINPPSLKRHKMVLFLGRVTYQKGPDYFVEAAARVLEVFPDTHFVMAGKGDMLTQLIERVAELHMGRKFHFTGFLDGDDVHKMFSLADVYVMPSVSEPFGISALEAISHNVPVIVSRQSGVSEVLRHCLTVDFWDTEDLSNNIISLLKRATLKNQLKNEMLSDLTPLTWNNSAKQVSGLYQKLNEKVTV
ncbi:MAG: glycogen(starch) synthase [Chlamydiales bacterium]